MIRFAVLCAILSTLVTGCMRAGGTVTGPGTYRDPVGWSIDVPEGWTARHFELHTPISSAEGVQVSNLGLLPTPSPEPGAPLQTNGSLVPRSGIAVVIATDDAPATDRERNFTPPLRMDEISEGSGLGQILATIRFRGDGHTFLLAAKISDGSYGRPYAAFTQLVRSLRFA